MAKDSADTWRIRRVRPQLSSDLELVLLSLLADRQQDRPGSAAEVLARVSRVTNAETTGKPRAAEGVLYPRDFPEAQTVLESVVDPLWRFLLEDCVHVPCLSRFEDGDLLCVENEPAFRVHILVSGKVELARRGELTRLEQREGATIGEVSALTGGLQPYEARAVGTVWSFSVNPAEFEAFAACNPTVAIRVMKQLADELHRWPVVIPQVGGTLKP